MTENTTSDYMDCNVLCMELELYEVWFNGFMYEVVNKVTDAVESSGLSLPQEIGNARAFNGVLVEYRNKGMLTDIFGVEPDAPADRF